MSQQTRLTALATRIAGECKSLWTAVNGKANSTHSHAIGDLPVAASGTSSATQVVRADDERLTEGIVAAAAASLSNLTLSGIQTVDGVALVAGDRVVANGQTDQVQNGVYIVASGAWARHPSFTGSGVGGRTVRIVGGTEHFGKIYRARISGAVGSATLQFWQVVDQIFGDLRYAYKTEAHEPGDIKMSGRATPTSGWLLCDGTFKSQTTYPDLYAAIGHTHNGGVDPGDGTFRLPVPGRFPMMANATYPRGATGGSTTKTLTETQLPPHVHGDGTLSTTSDGSHDHELTMQNADGSATGNARAGTSGTADTVSRGPINNDGSHSHDVTGLTGVGNGVSDPIDIMPPWAGFNFFIKT